MSLRATGYLLTRADCLLSVRQKKCLNEEKTASREVYRTPYWGKEKNRSVVKKNITILKEKNMLFVAYLEKVLYPEAKKGIVWLRRTIVST